MSNSQLVLISAADCHLCARAREVLTALALSVREIDVASVEAEALAEAGVPLIMLPVLWNGECVLAYGRFSERALRRRLAA